MREIKFRAWNEGQKIMEPIINMEWLWSDDKENHIIDFHGRETRMSDKLILMQFTGLHDSKGKEIYEGDILKYGDDEPQVVEYRDCCFCTYMEHNKHVLRLRVFGGINKFEVCGNIHENPDLLT